MKKIKPKLPFDFSKEATISVDEIASIFQRHLLLNKASRMFYPKLPKKQEWNSNWYIPGIEKALIKKYSAKLFTEIPKKKKRKKRRNTPSPSK